MVNKEVEKRVAKLKNKVATLEQQLAQAKYDLDHAYEDRYPKGRFIICRGDSPVWNGHGGLWLELYYEAGLYYEKHGHKNFGLSTKPHYKEDPISPGVYKAGWRCSIFRKTTQYDSLEKMLTACQKFEVPPELIRAFVEKYNEN